MTVEDMQNRIAELEAQREKAEASFVQREQQYRLIAENMKDAIWLMDMNLRFKYISPSMARARGYSTEELTALPLEKHMTQRSLELIRRAISEELEPEHLQKQGSHWSKTVQLEIFRKDGSTYFSEITITLLRGNDGSPSGLLGVGRDVTDRKKIESALLESEERYKRIANTLTDYIYTVTFEKGMPASTVHGPGCFMVTGYVNKDFLKNTLLWIQMVHPDDRQSVRNFINQIMTKPLAIPIEHRILKKDGSERWVRNTPVFHFDGSGNMLSYDGVVQDITERKQAEEALRRSEERYRSLFNGIQDLVAVSEMLPNGKPGKFVEVNNAMCTLIGYSLKELYSLSAIDITEAVPTEEYTRMAGKRLVGENFSFQRHLVARDGRKIPVDITNQIVDLAGKPYILAIARDMTEKRKMDAEMQKAQHLESLSMLAGGIAHDFNNLLGGIFGYIDIAREYAPTPEKSKEFLEKALKSLDRAKDLSQRLLVFSKGAPPVKKLVNIEDLIAETTALSLAGKDVKAHLTVAKDLCSCECDPAQIGRVLSNLIINAQQSMQNGGTVYISAENTMALSGQAAGAARGPFVRIGIRDTGAGIAPDQLTKIFDPFFTTKKTGTGLGLTISQSVIQKHGGVIEVASEVSKGTEFHVYLPASSQKAERILEKKLMTFSGKGTDHGRVLVMDDEDFVLDIASRMLVKMGFSPQTASHGEEACALYKKAIDDKEPFSAVVLDLTIPAGLGGVKTMSRLLAMDPKVKAIASSGYSDDPVLAEPGKYGFSGVLKKPYMADGLRDAIHRVLEKRPAEGNKKKAPLADKTKRPRSPRSGPKS